MNPVLVPTTFFHHPQYSGQILVSEGMDFERDFLADGEYLVHRATEVDGVLRWSELDQQTDTAAKAAVAGFVDAQIYMHRTFEERPDLLDRELFTRSHFQQFVANRVAQLATTSGLSFQSSGDPFEGAISPAAAKAIASVNSAMHRPVDMAFQELAALGVFKPHTHDAGKPEHQVELLKLMTAQQTFPGVDPKDEVVLEALQAGLHSDSNYGKIVGDWLMKHDAVFVQSLAGISADVIDHIETVLDHQTFGHDTLQTSFLGVAAGAPIAQAFAQLESLRSPPDNQHHSLSTGGAGYQVSVLSRTVNTRVQPMVVSDGVVVNSLELDDASVAKLLAEHSIHVGELDQYDDAAVGLFYSLPADVESLCQTPGVHLQHWLLVELARGEEVDARACSEFADTFQLSLVDRHKPLPTMTMR